jgi:Tfp pilus assembly protein PilF
MAAMRAIELKPESARAHQALVNVLFARGEIAAALAEGEKAVSLNPYDMSVLAAYGARLAMSVDLEKGAALLHQAAAGSPVRPPILNFALFLCAYLLGDDAAASYQVSLITSAASPSRRLFRREGRLACSPAPSPPRLPRCATNQQS